MSTPAQALVACLSGYGPLSAEVGGRIGTEVRGDSCVTYQQKTSGQMLTREGVMALSKPEFQIFGWAKSVEQARRIGDLIGEALDKKKNPACPFKPAQPLDRSDGIAKDLKLPVCLLEYELWHLSRD